MTIVYNGEPLTPIFFVFFHLFPHVLLHLLQQQQSFNQEIHQQQYQIHKFINNKIIITTKIPTYFSEIHQTKKLIFSTQF